MAEQANPLATEHCSLMALGRRRMCQITASIPLLADAQQQKPAGAIKHLDTNKNINWRKWGSSLIAHLAQIGG